MFKVINIILGLIALSYGLTFLIIPEFFINYYEPNDMSIGWIRILGATILAIQSWSLISIAINPIKKLHLYNIIILTVFLQSVSLIISKINDEFSPNFESLLNTTIGILLIGLITLIILRLNYKRDLR